MNCFFQDVFSVSSKPKIIQSTIKRLPVNYVIPFTTEVCQRFMHSSPCCFVCFMYLLFVYGFLSAASSSNTSITIQVCMIGNHFKLFFIYDEKVCGGPV